MAGSRYVNVMLLLLACLSVAVDCLHIEHIIVLSRHNIRTPLTARLDDTTPHKWPKWKYEVGHLTDKGALLERYMGEYFAEWLNQNGLITQKCGREEAFVYANTKQRTRESARAFADGLFPNCSFYVHSIDSDNMDPVFNPVLRDTSETTKRTIISEMTEKLNASKPKLAAAYRELNGIIDLKKSQLCKTESICDFLELEDEIIYEVGKEPNIVGPLATSNNVMDAFIMSYYEGMAANDVAWGKISSEQQWARLATIIRENQNIRFGSSALARDVAKPLLQYMKDWLLRRPIIRMLFLFGHDSNLSSVLSALGVKHYELPFQHEATPPGGKIVFQKWRDEEKNRTLLKMNYVYQTTEQIVKAMPLSSSSPPAWAHLELTACPTDSGGFCPWEQFENILNAAAG